MMNQQRKKSLLIAIIVWAVVVLSIRVLGYLKGVSFIYQNTAVITAVFLLYPPVILSIIFKTRIDYCSFKLKTWLTDLRVFSVVSLIVFPLVFLGNHLYQMIFWNASYHSPNKAAGIGMYIFTQLLLVALPEEFFFRGYLHDVFTKVFPAKKKIFGVPFGLGVVLVSIIFALSHSLITLAWWHGFIFFPALVFAWLREKTGTIWAAVLFHTSCNLFAYWAATHYI